MARNPDVTPPIPTIGRIVLFCGDDSQDRPAIVTHVWSPFCVNLQVFPKDSGDTGAGIRTSVTHAGPETNEKTTPNTWHWMPYQIQTTGQRHPDTPKPVSSKECGILVTTFGEAIEALKAGMKVARSGWNGKGMWLVLQVPDAHSKMTLPYVYIEYPAGHPAYPNGSRVPWLASQTDMLAEDWTVVA